VNTKTWIGLIGFGLLLTACAQKPPPPPPPPPFTTGEGVNDLIGQSQNCGDPKIVSVTDATTLTLTLSFVNDGGWCALRLQHGAGPFDAGLLPVLPQHGVVFIHKVQHFTRIDYTPNAAYVGPDSFIVKFLPGYLPVDVTVDVKGAGAPPPAAAAKP